MWRPVQCTPRTQGTPGGREERRGSRRSLGGLWWVWTAFAQEEAGLRSEGVCSHGQHPTRGEEGLGTPRRAVPGPARPPGKGRCSQPLGHSCPPGCPYFKQHLVQSEFTSRAAWRAACSHPPEAGCSPKTVPAPSQGTGTSVQPGAARLWLAPPSTLSTPHPTPGSLWGAPAGGLAEPCPQGG